MTLPSAISLDSVISDARIARTLGIRDTAFFEGFIREVWERKPAVWAAPDFPVRLGLNDVEDVLHSQVFREPDIRLLKGGQDSLTPSLYIDQRGCVRPDQVWSQLANGATLVIRTFDKRHPQTGDLCRELELIFHQPVLANLYVTPQAQQGLPLHQDYHDVLVCQLDGEKRWEVHECQAIPTESWPTFPKNEADAGPVLIRHTLTRGEIMYAPRGSHHRAVAGTGGSVHVTIGVHTKKWADLFIETVKQLLESHEPFRRALPFGFLDPSWKAENEEIWPRLLEALRTADTNPALDDLRRRLLKWCSVAPVQPAASAADWPWGPVLAADTTYWRAGLAHYEAGAAGQLHLPGLILPIAAPDADFARWLTLQTQFAAGDLPSDATDARREVLRQCLRTRVYRPVSAAS